MTQPPGGLNQGQFNQGQFNQGSINEAPINEGQINQGQINQAYLPQDSWVPVPPPSAMPTLPTRHPNFWRTSAWRVWKPIVALLIGGVVFLLLQVIAIGVAVGIDIGTGRVSADTFFSNLGEGRFDTTPAIFLANNIALALLIPLVLLLGRWPFGQASGFVSSVVGRLRWRLLLGYLAVVSVPWLVVAGLTLWSGRGDLHVNGDTWVLVVGILLTTPFQAAGEEYLFRAGINRAFASFVPWPVVGVALGGLVQAVLFMFAHGAGDRTLNIFYFFFALVAAWLVWRTGGLEAAIAVHVVNNLTSEFSLPFSDLSKMFDRQEGVASFADLWPTLVCLVIAVFVAEVFVRFRKPAVVGPPATRQPSVGA